jgi:hypothetical protein
MPATTTRIVLPVPVWKIVNEIAALAASRNARTVLSRTHTSIDDLELAIRQGYVFAIIAGRETIGDGDEQAAQFGRAFHGARHADELLRAVELGLTTAGMNWVHLAPASKLMQQLSTRPRAKHSLHDVRNQVVDATDDLVVALATAGLLTVYDPDGRELQPTVANVRRSSHYRAATVKLTSAGRSLYR